MSVVEHGDADHALRHDDMPIEAQWDLVNYI